MSNKANFAVMQKADNSLDIYIYDDVKADSFSWWSDEKIKSDTSAKTIADTLAENATAEKINLYINSYGGDVKEGLAIYNQLKRHPAKVTAYIDGFACSIASVIAMSADEVIMGNNALMMIHHAWMYAVGNAAELRKAADDLDIIDAASNSSYLAKAGDKLTEEKLNELLDAETWLNADDCIKYGLADRIGNAPDDKKDEANERLNAAKTDALEEARKQIEQRNARFADALFSFTRNSDTNKQEAQK